MTPEALVDALATHRIATIRALSLPSDEQQAAFDKATQELRDCLERGGISGIEWEFKAVIKQ